jgi:hypothetical protein
MLHADMLAIMLLAVLGSVPAQPRMALGNLQNPETLSHTAPTAVPLKKEYSRHGKLTEGTKARHSHR